MSIISSQDTNGVKPLLQVGELGYDNYPAGGDKGRVYVGTGTENVAIAKKSEVTVLDNKANTHIAKVDNPHNVTKAQVGLGNADNTADADKNVLSATKLTTPRNISLSGDVVGTVSFNGTANVSINTTIQPNSVVLGTDTTGNYTSSITAGDGITVTGTAGEGWSPTVAIAPVGTSGTYTKVTTNDNGQVVTGTILAASDIPNLDASKITSGIIDAARLPAYVDDVLEYARLSVFPVTGKAGKIYIALDTNKAYRWSGSTYVYITSGAVDSVAGKTGVVTLVKADVGLANVDNTSDANKPISTATQNALNTKVDTTTNQTIDGVKTFSSTISGSINGNAATATTATNVSGGKATVQGIGNDYHLGGVEVRGDGPANTVFPTIGFHQPAKYASSLQLRGHGDFRFYSLGGGYYANVTANAFIGNLSGNAATATRLSTTRTNYKDITDSVVVGELMWKAYGGNNHTIFDASNSTTPTGVAKNNTDPDVPWAPTYPTLMGYNGNTTFGVRVDSSRLADQLKTARTINGVAFDGTANITIADNTKVDKSANLADLTNAATARINLGLGTAATTHSTDYAKSQGRVVTDTNSVLDSGMYGHDASPANGVAGYGSLIVAKNVDTGLQIAGGYLTDGLWFRGFAAFGGIFSPWRAVHHTGNILQTTGQDNNFPMTQKAITDAINGISDERDKTEINEIGLGLEVIENLKTFSFKLNKRDWYRQEAARELIEVEEDGKVTTQEKINDDVLNAPLSDFEENDGSLKRDDIYTGFVAQDLKETLEALDLGHLGIVKNYAEEYEGGEDRFYIEHLALLPFLVNSVKQLSARVKTLEGRQGKEVE